LARAPRKRPRISRSRLDGSVAELWFTTFIRLADEGNLDAGRSLWLESEAWLCAGRPLPRTLAEWRTARLNAALEAPERAGQEMRVARQKGRPAQHADLNRFEAHYRDTTLKDTAAWAVFWEHEAGAPITSTSRETAPAIVAAMLSGWGYHRSERTVRNWFEKRRDAMVAHQEAVEQIRADVEADPGLVTRVPEIRIALAASALPTSAAGDAAPAARARGRARISAPRRPRRVAPGRRPT